MSDLTPETPAPATPNPRQSAAEALTSIRELFAVLSVPDRIEVVDTLGNTYSLRARIPARAQIRVMQEVDRLASQEAGGVDIAAISARAAGGGARGVMGAVIALTTQPGVLETLAFAFELSHPEAVAAARAAYELAVPSSAPRTLGALDLFGVEELAAGVVPFFLLLGRRLATIASEMMASPPER